MSLQALMALLGHVSTEMTLRYASLAAPAIRTAYEEAMGKARARLTLAIAPVGQPIIPDRIKWLRGEMLKTRVAHGYCSRQLAAEACPYANICEQCDNFVTAPEFIPRSRPSSPTSPRSATTPPNAAGTPKSPGTHASSPASKNTSTGSPETAETGQMADIPKAG